MAFFLIGRDPDGDLRLLSNKPFESRQAAMAELSHLSAEPTFEHWEAEVSVMDLDSGVPVLLVRPAAAEAVGQSAPAETGDAGAWEADLPIIVTPAPELVSVAVPVLVTPEPELEEAALVADAIEASSWEPPAVALIEPVGDIAIAEAIVAEATAAEPSAAEAVPELEETPPAPELIAIEADLLPIELEPAIVPEPELVPWVEPVNLAEEAPVTVVEPAAEPAVDENDELRAAIQRTTEHMSAEGIVAPESIGPAREVAEAPEVEEPATEAAAIEVAAVPEAPVAEAVDPIVPAEETVSEPGPDVEAVGHQESPLPAAEPAQTEAAEPGVTFWPWDKSAAAVEPESEVAPEVAGVYNALEEPAEELPEPDVEAVLSSTGAEPRAGAPIIELEPAEPQGPMSTLPAEEPVASAAPASPEESDFILDLDGVESQPGETSATDAAPAASSPATDVTHAADEQADPIETAEPASPAQPFLAATEPTTDAVSPLEDYTCDDCVHTETCPNRDQRLPKDCGSFQWR